MYDCTKELNSGVLLPGMFNVLLDLRCCKVQYSLLLYIFTELWLKSNCKKLWYIETQNVFNTELPNPKILVGFQDSKEAVYFKLSRQFQLNNSNYNF